MLSLLPLSVTLHTHTSTNSFPNICFQSLIFDDEIIAKNTLSFHFRIRTFHVLSKMVYAINDYGLTDVYSTIFNIETYRENVLDYFFVVLLLFGKIGEFIIDRNHHYFLCFQFSNYQALNRSRSRESTIWILILSIWLSDFFFFISVFICIDKILFGLLIQNGWNEWFMIFRPTYSNITSYKH